MRAIFLAVAAILSFGSISAHAQHADDKAALQGLNEVKVIFDLTDGDGKTLNTYLNVVEEARQSLIKQGVKPQIVLAFRGPATRLVQTDQSQIKPEDREYATKIAATIKALSSAEGVAAIEQCGVAVRMVGTKPENVVPGVKVVGNSWISLAGYQAKGYGYISP
jgi:intracellular sulfur oxidation DsrE/DsrF family protein